MSCLAKIRAYQDELSPNEKKIARFILDNPALIRDYSSQSLASSVGVSQSSIVKFSQKLGFRGFTDLKLAIHEAVLTGSEGDRNGSVQHVVVDADASAAEQLYQAKSQALLGTKELNDEKQLLAAVEILEKSKRIEVMAQGSSTMAAGNFASLLTQIGYSVVADRDIYMQLALALSLGKGDAIFHVSLTDPTPRMLEVVKQAKRAGVAVITLTSYSASPIRPLADVQLFCVGRSGDFDVPQIVSSTSQQCIVDLLFSLIVRRNRKARELLALSRKAVENV
jgi:RpiR family murPQ operon transcriptional repressor